MIRLPDGRLILDLVGSVAEVLGVSPRFLYFLSNHIEENYKITKIPKKNGKFRTIEAPSEMLKYVQLQILKHVLPTEVSTIATAFESGRGLLDNVKMHARRKVVLALDLKDFFPSFRFPAVESLFETFGFSRQTAVLLAKICTLNGHLPQGAPTSPHLANLFMTDFDAQLSDLCRRMRLRVSRYADDITISGNLDKVKIEFLIRTCRELLRQKGLRINYRKIRILRRNARQEVTGVVVNERPSVPRRMRRELRQRMYYLRHFGLVGHEPVTRQGLQSLLGSVGFVNYIDPRNVEFRQYAEQLKRYLKERP